VQVDEDNVIRFAGRVAKQGSLLEAGGPVDAICVTLALYGEHLDPDWVTAQLGVQPTASYRKGDARRTGAMPAHRGGGWFLEEVGDAPATPETLTRALLDSLAHVPPETWAQLAQHFDIQLHYALYLYSFNRGFDLGLELTWRIASMRARMVFDIYAG
jgi:LmbE family N-acetylglucosaminyl deacetylase